MNNEPFNNRQSSKDFVQNKNRKLLKLRQNVKPQKKKQRKS
ncbi:hypothetical protein CALK_0634 [Chitinivibrio alkaliphilus ACht1]|uniref:Uncharacterized protein n=1 Tax=Chitinivibrio alkaliphilus ACht1 TaxID=1313304 RepID=U7DA30_9BACT|nr:hypothetical protein CALK_0634 [Chitinivibrio alkaliphilus ACht1]